ncbi:MAG: dTDP-4-dehydrorhamnose reductase [Chitinophagaceae bacterium]
MKSNLQSNENIGNIPLGDRGKILITGANGQLGNELRELSVQYSQYQFIFLSKDNLDISDEEKTLLFVKSISPDFCINCAAYTAVDKAEAEKEIAYKINAEGAGNLATAAKNSKTRFIHISTDYVFNGRSDKPYSEDYATDPINVYGHSKLQGEILCQKENEEAIIIRTSWVFSSFGNNFVKTMLRLMQTKKEISVVSDQYGCPTYAADLAQLIMQIINAKNWVPGIFHFSNEGETNWYEFANAIKEVTRSNCLVHPISTEQYPTPAQRPRYSVLSKEKIKRIYGVVPKHWKDSLRICLEQLH